MTISSSTNKVIYTANGVLTDFDFTFKTRNASDIQVYLDDVLQGSGYTVNLNSDQEASPGGTVVFDSAPADQVIVTIVREVPLTQEVDYQPYDPFPAETHEGALDKLTQISQQQQEELDRTTKASISDDGTTDYTLPLYDAGKAIVWDEAEKKLVNSNDQINDITDTAQQSADDAAVSAAAADSSATDAANSATDAANSATDADNTLKDFETKYLGAKASDPTLDNEGNALIDGALYYNTTVNETRVYDLGNTTWKTQTDSYTKTESDDRYRNLTESAWTYGGKIITTSGSNAEFTSIPSWATHLRLILYDVSESVGQNILCQIGDTGGFETTGYGGAESVQVNAAACQVAAIVSGCGIATSNAAAGVNGVIEVTRAQDNDTDWVFTFLGGSGLPEIYTSVSAKSLSAALDRVRLTILTGSFDNGSVVLYYS